MADPLTLVSMGASVAGGLTGAIGSVLGGNAQANMYNYQAGVARLNQQIANQNAAYERETGEVQAQQSGLQTRAQVGETKSAQGANNVDVNTGSAAAVRDSETALGQENEAIIRADAAKKAYGYEVQGVQEGAQANIYGMAASGAKTAGTIQGLSTALGAAGSVSSKWLDWSKISGSSSGSGGSSSGNWATN